MTVMGEVLEHVEQPAAFLVKLRECTKPGGLSYLTTCVNAPAIDHIYLFDRVAMVEEMIESSGYAIEQRLHVPYPTKSVEECERRGLSINVAYYARVPA